MLEPLRIHLLTLTKHKNNRITSILNSKIPLEKTLIDILTACKNNNELLDLIKIIGMHDCVTQPVLNALMDVRFFKPDKTIELCLIGYFNVVCDAVEIKKKIDDAGGTAFTISVQNKDKETKKDLLNHDRLHENLNVKEDAKIILTADEFECKRDNSNQFYTDKNSKDSLEEKNRTNNHSRQKIHEIFNKLYISVTDSSLKPATRYILLKKMIGFMISHSLFEYFVQTNSYVNFEYLDEVIPFLKDPYFTEVAIYVIKHVDVKNFSRFNLANSPFSNAFYCLLPVIAQKKIKYLYSLLDNVFFSIEDATQNILMMVYELNMPLFDYDVKKHFEADFGREEVIKVVDILKNSELEECSHCTDLERKIDVGKHQIPKQFDFEPEKDKDISLAMNSDNLSVIKGCEKHEENYCVNLAEKSMQQEFLDALDEINTTKKLKKYDRNIFLFLRYSKKTNLKNLGDFITKEYNIEALKLYLDTFDFRGIDALVAARIFLGSFIMPGEGQIIYRVIEHFNAKYCSENDVRAYFNEEVKNKTDNKCLESEKTAILKPEKTQKDFLAKNNVFKTDKELDVFEGDWKKVDKSGFKEGGNDKKYTKMSEFNKEDDLTKEKSDLYVSKINNEETDGILPPKNEKEESFSESNIEENIYAGEGEIFNDENSDYFENNSELHKKIETGAEQDLNHFEDAENHKDDLKRVDLMNDGIIIGSDEYFADKFFFLFYSIVTLNTTLHNPIITNKTTVEQFILSLRGFKEVVLRAIYNDIKKESLKFNTNNGISLLHFKIFNELCEVLGKSAHYTDDFCKHCVFKALKPIVAYPRCEETLQLAQILGVSATGNFIKAISPRLETLDPVSVAQFFGVLKNYDAGGDLEVAGILLTTLSRMADDRGLLGLFGNSERHRTTYTDFIDSSVSFSNEFLAAIFERGCHGSQFEKDVIEDILQKNIKRIGIFCIGCLSEDSFCSVIKSFINFNKTKIFDLICKERNPEGEDKREECDLRIKESNETTKKESNETGYEKEAIISRNCNGDLLIETSSSHSKKNEIRLLEILKFFIKAIKNGSVLKLLLKSCDFIILKDNELLEAILKCIDRIENGMVALDLLCSQCRREILKQKNNAKNIIETEQVLKCKNRKNEIDNQCDNKNHNETTEKSNFNDAKNIKNQETTLEDKEQTPANQNIDTVPNFYKSENKSPNEYFIPISDSFERLKLHEPQNDYENKEPSQTVSRKASLKKLNEISLLIHSKHDIFYFFVQIEKVEYVSNGNVLQNYNFVERYRCFFSVPANVIRFSLLCDSLISTNILSKSFRSRKCLVENFKDKMPLLFLLHKADLLKDNELCKYALWVFNLLSSSLLFLVDFFENHFGLLLSLKKIQSDVVKVFKSRITKSVNGELMCGCGKHEDGVLERAGKIVEMIKLYELDTENENTEGVKHI